MSGNTLFGRVRTEGTVVVGRRRAQGNSTAGFYGVVLTAVVIRVEKLLEPLQELEIVLESPFYELINGNHLKCCPRQMGWLIHF